MTEFKFEVLIQKDLPQDVEGVVAFGDFVSSKGTACIYSEVTSFYKDLLLGKSFPLVLVLRELNTFGKFVAVSLFLHRDLAISPKMLNLVASAHMVDQFGLVGLSHIEPDLCELFKFIKVYISKEVDQQSKLTSVISWICEYVTCGTLPLFQATSKEPVIFDTGTNGFVLAYTEGSLEDGWISLFRQGYLRGALFGGIHHAASSNVKRDVLVAKKSDFLVFDLKSAATILNEAELVASGNSGWFTDGHWLESPIGGTFLQVSDVVKVLLHT